MTSNPRISAGIFIFLCAVFLAVGFGYGPLITSDGERDYDLSKYLLSTKFDLFEFFRTNQDIKDFHEMTQSEVNYILYYIILVLTLLISPDQPVYFLIFINCTVSSYIFLHLFKTTSNSSIGILPGILILIQFMTCWEYIQWFSMTQPDSLFISLSALILTMNIRVFDPNFDTNSSRYFLMLLLISVLSFFFRPIGIVFSWWLLTTITIYLFWRRGIPLSTAFQCVIGMFVLALIVGTVLIHDPDLLPFGVLAKPLAIYHNEIFQGHVVWVRPETYVTGGDDIFSFLKVSILRVCYFFWFLADDFSFGHKVLNITFFPALYGFAVVGLYTACAATRADRMQISGWIALMATACVLSFAVFHAVTLLDYNWRYRGPVYPALFLLSAIGVQNVARTFMARGLPLPAFVHSLLKEAK